MTKEEWKQEETDGTIVLFLIPSVKYQGIKQEYCFFSLSAVHNPLYFLLKILVLHNGMDSIFDFFELNKVFNIPYIPSH